MSREFHAATSSYSSFNRLRAGCGVLTIRTSAHLTSFSTTCSALGDFRSSAIPRLLRLARCHGYASFACGCGGILCPCLQRSPDGGSTLITFAPKSDRITAALGPAMKLARSTTFNPEKMLSPVMDAFLVLSADLGHLIRVHLRSFASLPLTVRGTPAPAFRE